MPSNNRDTLREILKGNDIALHYLLSMTTLNTVIFTAGLW